MTVRVGQSEIRRRIAGRKSLVSHSDCGINTLGPQTNGKRRATSP